MEGMHPQAPKAREEGLVIRELPEETLVYDLRRHRAHSLNASAALVWRHCDGSRTVAQLAELLERELDMPADEEVVWFALKRLERARLLSGSVTPPGDGADRSRRALLRKLGMAAVLVPLV